MGTRRGVGVTSRAENDFELPITAEAGKNVFVWQEVKMGLIKARTKLNLVDEAGASRA